MTTTQHQPRGGTLGSKMKSSTVGIGAVVGAAVHARDMCVRPRLRRAKLPSSAHHLPGARRYHFVSSEVPLPSPSFGASDRRRRRRFGAPTDDRPSTPTAALGLDPTRRRDASRRPRFVLTQRRLQLPRRRTGWTPRLASVAGPAAPSAPCWSRSRRPRGRCSARSIATRRTSPRRRPRPKPPRACRSRGRPAARGPYPADPRARRPVPRRWQRRELSRTPSPRSPPIRRHLGGGREPPPG